jgi:hypothetical protein
VGLVFEFAASQLDSNTTQSVELVVGVFLQVLTRK